MLQPSVLEQVNIVYDFAQIKKKWFTQSTDLSHLMTSFGKGKGHALHSYTLVYAPLICMVPQR